jgi:hypothetical protein
MLSEDLDEVLDIAAAMKTSGYDVEIREYFPAGARVGAEVGAPVATSA